MSGTPDQQNTKNKTLILFKKGDIMKIGYLAYAVFNLDDGYDFIPIGVYTSINSAIESTKSFMIDNDDEHLVNNVTGFLTVYKEDYTRYYDIRKVRVEE